MEGTRMITWDRVIKNALAIYNHRDQYTYCLGGCGERVEDQKIRDLYNYYYQNGYKEKMGMNYEQWAKVNAGKRCFDCSGFVAYCCGHTKHDLSSWDYGSMKKNASLAAGVAGSALWFKGHVGLDMGYGYFLHFPGYNRTCEFGNIAEFSGVWTSSHLINGVDYAGSDAR